MLEVKNLTKIYKMKGGTEVRALDDVSLRFGETGMVFLLGKSGSGKSTLLNVAGGLDSPSQGEIIVMGKSSKDFTGSDFDSYRNTFVGFVFQEYNVLNEFNVEENVALALELQGKTREREKVQSILEEVELSELAKRKPATLSGGQRQRVAIARALVKDPQIIMADEPTGALDSATGKQVFDTLKRLSGSRLVLVVSHDREFAEEYGDRIIELKDGRVISDVTKSTLPDHDDLRIKRLDENTLSVKGGEPDEATMQAVRAFLVGSKGNILLSKGEAAESSLKQLGKGGQRGQFLQTDESSLPVRQYENTQFIRSRLPLKKAFRLGASGLKLKPIRLALTILLSFFAFTMFGLLSTLMLYQPKSVMKRSFLNGSYEYVTLEKNYTRAVKNLLTEEIVPVEESAKFTPEEVASFGEGAFGLYSAPDCSCYNFTLKANAINYYRPKIGHFAYLPEGAPLREKLTGSYPQNAHEVAVSSYFLSCARAHAFFGVKGENGGTDFSTQKQIISAEDLIGEYLVGLPGSPLKVTGVFDSGKIPAIFDSLKPGARNGPLADIAEYDEYLFTTPHSLFLTSEDYFYAVGIASSVQYFPLLASGAVTMTFTQEQAPSLSEHVYTAAQLYSADASLRLPVYFLGETKTTLASDEVILPLADLFEYYDTGYFDRLHPLPENSTQEEAAAYRAEREQFKRTFFSIAVREIGEGDEAIHNYPSQEELAAAVDELLGYFGELPAPTVQCNEGTFRVAGFSLPDYLHEYTEGFYCPQQLFDRYRFRSNESEETKYQKEADAVFSEIMVPIAKKSAPLDDFLGRIDVRNEQTDVTYTMRNVLYTNILSANRIVDTLSMIFLIGGLVLALFSALLLFNFISMTIANKTKEIGILRAVGARGIDVFKIFSAESGIIVSICTLLAIAGSIAVTTILNHYLRTEIGIEVALFIFGPLSVVIMIAVAAAVAFFATFFPVCIAAKKKPVESIRTL